MNIEIKNQIRRFLDKIFYALGIISFFILVYRLGFKLPDYLNQKTFDAIQIIILIFCVQEILRWFLIRDYLKHLINRAFENIILVVFIFIYFRGDLLHSRLSELIPGLTLKDITLFLLGSTQVLLLLGQFIRFFRASRFLSKITLSTSQMFSLSFLVPILIGTFLFKMPNATVNGISWMDAFFTATSAVCVTGLSTLTISQEFTFLGQIILCALIQLGGLGIMTLTLSFGMILTGGLGLKERLLMSDIFSEDRLGEVKSLLSIITIYTLIIELLGAVFLYISKGYSFVDFNLYQFWLAFFHSVSAFCNAGFSLYDLGFVTDFISNNKFYGSIIMLLIVLGGLGFPVVMNLYDKVNPFKENVRISTQSKLILISTLVLILTGAMMMYFAESKASLTGMNFQDKWYHSLFLSITARTAGYNLIPIENLSLVGCLFIIVLMWIGGSPMSTAGGIKNLTFMVALLSLRSIVTGRPHVSILGREIYDTSIIRAFSIIAISVFFIFLSTVVMILLEPSHKALDLFFEVVSAIGTVGLSRGITGNLTEESKALLILLMFSGRIGLIVFLGSFFNQKEEVYFKYLKENIPIN